MQYMFTEKIKATITIFAAATFLLTSCEKKYSYEIAEDPGYVTDPVVAVRALDGDKWIQGSLDQEARAVTFEFHTVANLENIVLEVELNKHWAEMVSPKQAKFTANVKSDYKFTVNNGYDDVTYTVKSSMYRQIVEVKATLGEETITLLPLDNSFTGSFHSAYLAADLKNVSFDVSLNEDVELVTVSDKLKGLDLSDGEGVAITVLDKSVNRKKTFMAYTNPSDVASIDATWTEVTKSWGNEFGINFGKVRMYKTEQLNGVSGNVGYLLTIPAGFVEMKSAEKNIVSDARISGIVREFRDYVIFVPFQGPAVWHTDGSTATSGYEYYSPLSYGPDKNGVTKVLRNDGFGGSKKTYAPALAIKEGRLQIKPAGAEDGKLYCYDDAKGNGKKEWDVEAAAGGMFQIVKDGVALVTGESDRTLQTYNQDWRAYPDLTINTTPKWAPEPIIVHDKLRTGRLAIGCTADGALILLSVEKLVNTHNQGQAKDQGRDGSGSDPRGLSLYGLSQMMANLGCSDAMTMEDYHWSYVILQDGSERGKDLFMTNSRWYFNDKVMKTNEDTNLNTICIK